MLIKNEIIENGSTFLIANIDVLKMSKSVEELLQHLTSEKIDGFRLKKKLN